MDDFNDSGTFNTNTPRPNGGLDYDNQPSTIKDKVGQSLESAAGALRNRSKDSLDQNSKIARFGSETANGLDRVASYVREADAQKVRRDFEQTVRTNPGRSLIVAGVAGLLIGSLLRRR
jgi:ElaB/YqjD/DUF883 family membrane-anchored ribosome-binding protein